MCAAVAQKTFNGEVKAAADSSAIKSPSRYVSESTGNNEADLKGYDASEEPVSKDTFGRTSLPEVKMTDDARETRAMALLFDLFFVQTGAKEISDWAAPAGKTVP